jgi:hypothetical protein
MTDRETRQALINELVQFLNIDPADEGRSNLMLDLHSLAKLAHERTRTIEGQKVVDKLLCLSWTVLRARVNAYIQQRGDADELFYLMLIDAFFIEAGHWDRIAEQTRSAIPKDATEQDKARAARYAHKLMRIVEIKLKLGSLT